MEHCQIRRSVELALDNLFRVDALPPDLFFIPDIIQQNRSIHTQPTRFPQHVFELRCLGAGLQLAEDDPRSDLR